MHVAVSAVLLEEIFAYGMRNPWRFSFDRKTEEIYAGDVGSSFFEEIDRIESGRFYGWPIYEGVECQQDEGCKEEYTQPVTDDKLPTMKF